VGLGLGAIRLDDVLGAIVELGFPVCGPVLPAPPFANQNLVRGRT
jgi:hypothetical protein